MATTNSGTTASELFGTSSPVSGSVPSAATDGQPLADLDAITVVVDTANTVTLSGAGTLQGYIYDGSTALWTRCPALDLAVSTASVRSLAFEPFEVIGGRNARVKWVPNAVTFSAGTAGVTVYQLGHSKKLQGRY